LPPSRPWIPRRTHLGNAFADDAPKKDYFTGLTAVNNLLKHFFQNEAA